MRNYVNVLKGIDKREGNLVPVLRQLAAKFSATTGIAVDLEATGDLHITDRLAAEVLQMVAEGLDNVRRHTHRPACYCQAEVREGQLLLRIEKEGPRELLCPPLTPRSISERPSSLGGQAFVERWTPPWRKSWRFHYEAYVN